MPIQAPPALVAFETATRLRVATVDLSAFGRDAPTDVAASSIGKTVYVATNCQVVAVDATTQRVTAVIPPPNEWCCAQRVATDAAGSLVVASDRSSCGSVWMIDPAQGRIVVQSDIAQSESISVVDISGLAISPDATRAFVMLQQDEDQYGREYRLVVAVDTTTGVVLQRHIFDGGWDGEIAVSPDGTTLYAGDWEGSLTVLNAHTLDVLAAFSNDPVVSPSAGFDIHGLTFAPDGDFAVVVLSKRFGDESVAPTLVQIRETATHTVVRRVYLDASAGRPAIDPDTGLVYVPVQDALGRVAVIDPKRGELVEQVPLGEGPVAIAFGPGSQSLTTPTATPRPTPHQTPQPAELCAYLAHGPAAASGGGVTTLNAAARLVSRWQPVGRPPTDEWSNDAVGVYGVALSPDGTTVYATTAGAVLVIDAASGTVRNEIEVGSGAGAIAVRPDGAIAYVGKPSAIGVVDLQTETLVDAFFVYGTPTDIAFTPDGALAYVTRLYDSDSVLVVDASTHKVTATIDVWEGNRYTYTGTGNRLAIAPNGESVYVAVDHSEISTPSNVVVVDRATQRLRAQWQLPISGAPGSMAIHPDGSRIYVVVDPHGCRDDPATGWCFYRHNAIAVLDTTTGTTLATLSIDSGLGEIGVSPDGSLLYATGPGIVTVIDATSYAILATITTADSPGRLTLGFAHGGCPLRDAIGTLPSRTPTPTWLLRYTATPTPRTSLSPQPSATPTACTGPCVAVELSIARGRAGERSEILARVRTGGLQVAGVMSQIEWSPSIPIPERLEYQPDCAPAGDSIADITAFAFGPAYYYEGWGPSPCWVGFDCRFVRALVVAYSRGPIPDGAVLYSCQVAIAPDAAPGRYPLHLQVVDASDPAGHPLPARGVDGAVEVLTAYNQASAQLGVTSSEGGGCHIDASCDGNVIWPVVLAALTLWAAPARGWRSRSTRKRTEVTGAAALRFIRRQHRRMGRTPVR